MSRAPVQRPRDRYGRPLPAGRRNELAGHDDAERTPEEAIALGIALFDEQRFFEAHELFEAVWRSPEIDPSERPFWRAMTQAAAGCCHVQRGNAPGAAAVIGRACRELARWTRGPGGIDVAALRLALERLGPGLELPRLAAGRAPA